jgi:hypothetical protein
MENGIRTRVPSISLEETSVFDHFEDESTPLPRRISTPTRLSKNLHRIIYTCTVGSKSSAAKAYIGSVQEVLKGLELLVD